MGCRVGTTRKYNITNCNAATKQSPTSRRAGTALGRLGEGRSPQIRASRTRMRTEARSNCDGGRAKLSERHGRVVLGGRGVRTWRCPHGRAGPPGALPIDLAPPPLGPLAGRSNRAAARTACCPPPRERSLHPHPCPPSPLPSRPAACLSAVESRLHRAAGPRRLGRSHG